MSIVPLFRSKGRYSPYYMTIESIESSITGTGNKLEDVAYNLVCSNCNVPLAG